MSQKIRLSLLLVLLLSSSNLLVVNLLSYKSPTSLEMNRYNNEIKVSNNWMRSETKTTRYFTEISQIQNIEILLKRAKKYTQQGNLQQAIETFHEVLMLAQQQRDKENEAIANLGIGLNYFYSNQYQKTLKHYNQALQISKEIGDRQLEANILGQFGFVYARLGDKKKSSEYFQKSHSILGKLSNHIKTPSSSEWPNAPDLETFYNTSKSKHQELNNLLQQLQVSKEIGNPLQQASLLYEIGGLYLGLGEPQKSIDYLKQSLAIGQPVYNNILKIETLATLGNIYNALGDKEKALEYYEQGLLTSSQSYNPFFHPLLNRSFSDKQVLFNTLIGDIYINLGEIDKALEYLEKSLIYYKKVNYNAGIATTLTNIGNIHAGKGDLQKSLEYLNNSLPIYKRALLTSREKNNQHAEINILINIAKVYANLGESKKSLDYFNECLPIVQKRGDRLTEADVLGNIGYIYVVLGESQKSLDYFKKSLLIYDELGNTYRKARTHAGIALVERNNGNLSEALTQIRNAIVIVESLRAKFVSPELRQTYFSSVQSYYQFYINVSMGLHQQHPNQGYATQAFDMSERSRARTLIELLAEANVNIRQGVDSNLLQQEHILRQQLSILDQRWTKLKSSQNSTKNQENLLKQERKYLLSKYEDLQTRIRVDSPHYAAITQPKPLTLDQVQHEILDSDTVLLQYYLGEEKSYLWVVTKEEMVSYQIPPRQEIEEKAEGLRQAIRYGKGNLDALTQSANQLSQIILFPAMEKLHKKRLLIVADGVLQYIPFSALSLSETWKPLIKKYEIVNLPSSSSLAIIRNEIKQRETAPKALAILADPVFSQHDKRVKISRNLLSRQQNLDLNTLALRRSVRSLEGEEVLKRLPGTRQEAKAILKLVPNSQQTHAFDFDANLSAATTPQLSKYRIIHFATHGIFNAESPELSGVVLSLVNNKGNPINGFLRLHEIFNLNLPAEIIVLSACQTGRGQEIKGEGLVGLTRGFMYAGSPRVLVSLWKVDDRATAEMMTIFYRLMLEKKFSPAEALREAQLEMQTKTEWESPYYWAAFVLQGEWQ